MLMLKSALLNFVLPDAETSDLWIGDRNFCTLCFMFGINDRLGKCLIRQHGNVQVTLLANANLREKPTQARSTNKIYVLNVQRVADF